jgi:hypothetical protein
VGNVSCGAVLRGARGEGNGCAAASENDLSKESFVKRHGIVGVYGSTEAPRCREIRAE